MPQTPGMASVGKYPMIAPGGGEMGASGIDLNNKQITEITKTPKI